MRELPLRITVPNATRHVQRSLQRTFLPLAIVPIIGGTMTFVAADSTAAALAVAGSGIIITLGYVLIAANKIGRDLDRSIHNFHAFSSNGPFTAFIKDAKDGVYIYVNKLFADLFILTPGGVVGKSDRDILPAALANDVMAEDRRIIAEMKKSEKVIPVPHQDGVTRYWFAVRFPVIGGDGRPLVGGFGVDITARLEAENVAANAQKSLLQSYKHAALGEVASNIAHEILNPMTIVDGKARQVKKNLLKESASETLVKDVDAVIDAAERVTKIISGLRTISRHSDKDPVIAADAATIVEETIALCHSRIKAAGVDVEFKRPLKAIEVMCRPGEISQIILNLITNAIDAVSVAPVKWIHITIKTTAESVEFAVLDTGYGIPKEIRSRIMEPFFTTKAAGSGTGLGLSLSLAMAVGHGGSLELDEQSPKTRFVLRLPTVPVRH